MSQPTRILIVDDDPIVAESLAEFLRQAGYGTATAGDGREAMEMLDQAAGDGDGGDHAGKGTNGEGANGAGPFGILIADLNLPRGDGMSLLEQMRQKHAEVVPIVVTGYGKIETAVEAVRLGAVDYLTKPVVDDELRLAVSKAQNQHVLVAENRTLRTQLAERYGLGNLIGTDPRMQRVYDLVEAVAPTKTTVLITGESGTGKFMVARAIHTLSPRGESGPFVGFSCGAIPETLLESELFGHVKGAFTGADYDKPGKCLAADGGTLLIDEINSATPALQLKLLRVLQEKAFEPIGSTRTRQVDVRFVLATNHALEELVRQGAFREDLYYRVNVVNIHMPALRERRQDIPLLAEHFLEQHCAELNRQRRFSEEALAALRGYDWPGNVRELANAVERAVVLSRSVTIDVPDLPETVIGGGERGEAGGGPGPSSSSAGHNREQRGAAAVRVPALAEGWTPTPLPTALEPAERAILLAALEANDWNRQQTARQLEINRTTLYKKIKHHGLEVSPDQSPH